MARYGPPDDFNNQPTRYGGYGGYPPQEPPPYGPPPGPPAQGPSPYGWPPQAPPPEQYEPLGVDEPADGGRPWYRKPVPLIGWAILVLILLALIAYGVTQLFDRSTSNGPSLAPTSSSTTTTTTIQTPTTTTTTTTTEPTTTPTTAPPANPPRNQPPGTQPTQQPPRRPRIPELPSTITIPGGPTITLPNLPR